MAQNLQPASYPAAKSRARSPLFAGVAVALAVPLLLLGLLRLLDPDVSGGGLLPGRPAPDFALSAENGATHRLADYRGRAVFLAFAPRLSDAATLAEARSLKATAASFDEAGAKVFLITPDGADRARAFHETEKLPFPVLTDAKGALAKRFGVTGRRVTYVVEPSGGIKFRISRVDVAAHGRQLLNVSNCCLDERVAAMSAGVGKKIGDFSLPRADKPGAPMTTVLGGKTQTATVVLFTSARCPCANAYTDRVRDLAAAFLPRGVRFVGVYSNQDESLADIAAHARDARLGFPALKDDRAQAADHFKAHVTPEVFVLDKNAVLRYHGRFDDSRDPAQTTTHELRDAVSAVLSGKPAPAETHAFGCAILRQSPAALAQTASGG